MLRTDPGITTRRNVLHIENVPSAISPTLPGISYVACSAAFGYTNIRVIPLSNNTPSDAQNDLFPSSTTTARNNE